MFGDAVSVCLCAEWPRAFCVSFSQRFVSDGQTGFSVKCVKGSHVLKKSMRYFPGHFPGTGGFLSLLVVRQQSPVENGYS